MRFNKVAFLALALSACQTIHEEMPTSSTPSTLAPAPIPVIVVPAPIPVPVPGTPAPAPGEPAPAPAPAPAPGGGGSCSLGSSRENSCSRTSPAFLGDVEAAIDRLVQVEPSLFILNKTQGCGNCYEVLNPSRYVQRMAEMVRARGLCSIYDGEELAVKNTNSFSDQYDILTAQNFIRRQGGSYRVTCHPAAF